MDIKAMACGYPWFPKLFNWAADEYLKEGAGQIEEKVQPHQTVTSPKHEIASFSGNKDPQILK